jgi:hypothetical protein
MFGLIQANELDATKSNHVRREVFYENLTGGFPLMGLLSLMEEQETIDKMEFGWNEERDVRLQSQTASATANGPYTDANSAAGAVGTDMTTGGFSWTAGTTYRIKVDDASVFRERDTVAIKDAPGTASSVKQLYGIIQAVWTSPNTIDVYAQETVANVLNTTAANDIWVSVIGSAATEGGYAKEGGMVFPIEVSNYSQIERTPVGPFSRNALHMGQKFDKTGAYDTASRQAHVRHMTTLEWPAFFGRRTTQNIIDQQDGKTKRVRTTGGILFFLEQWELGNTTNTGLWDYRPGGADITSSSWLTEDKKRIIRLAGGTITYDQWQRLLKLAFDDTGDQTFEKICICGSGFLYSVNKMFERQGVKMVAVNEKSRTYGMWMYQVTTVFGDLYFKTHPLFTRSPDKVNSAFIVDLSTLAYHAAQGADSELRDNVQLPSFDGRLDEWLTEYLLEVRYPERNLYVDKLGGISL